MKKTQKNLILLGMLFATSLVISNVVTGKLVDTGVPIFGANILLPGAVCCYAITFLVTDIVGEIWGKTEANQIVNFGFMAQILATALIIFTQFLPTPNQEVQTAYNLILGQNAIFMIGSLTAYYLSQKWDVWVFHKLRNAYVKNHGSNKNRWIWNNLSTMTSQIIDTVIFSVIAFGIGFGWLFKPEMYSTLFGMMIGQYLFKFLLALIDTPFFYLFTKRQESPELLETP